MEFPVRAHLRRRREAVRAVRRHQDEEHVRQAGARHRAQHVLIDGTGKLAREWRGVKVPGHVAEVLDVRQDACNGPRRSPRVAGAVPFPPQSLCALRALRPPALVSRVEPGARIAREGRAPRPRPTPRGGPWSNASCAPPHPRCTSSPVRASRPSPAPPSATKLFVLDTNVLMHDPTSLFRFEEHDIYLPILTLEELDNNKKGMTEVARNARQVSRFLDELVTAHGETGESIAKGIPLDGQVERRRDRPAVPADREHLDARCRRRSPAARRTTRSSRVVMHLRAAPSEAQRDPGVEGHQHAHQGARARASPPRTTSTTRCSRTPISSTPARASCPRDFWDRHGKGMESWQQGGHTYYRDHRPARPVAAAATSSSTRRRRTRRRSTRSSRRSPGKTALLSTLKDYTHQKNNVWGITARNREQNFALNLLMNPEIDFVTLLGQAGTGKTLLTLAAGPDADARVQGLHRDHHDARHGARSARTSASCPAPRRRR